MFNIEYTLIPKTNSIWLWCIIFLYIAGFKQLIFKKMFLFTSEAEWPCRTESYFICWFTLQMPSTVKSRPGLNQEPETPHRSPTGLEETKVIGSSPAVPMCISKEQDWKYRVARTSTSSKLLHHNIHPYLLTFLKASFIFVYEEYCSQ